MAVVPEETKIEENPFQDQSKEEVKAQVESPKQDAQVTPKVEEAKSQPITTVEEA